MLAIGRALLGNPRLLVMDEPTEGLAPIIVEQVEAMLVQLAEDGDMAVLLIEQNIGVATAVSDHVAIMVNGRINRVMETGALAADRELQQRLLGVGKQDEERRALAGGDRGRRERRRADGASLSRGTRRGRRSRRSVRDSPAERSTFRALEHAGDEPAAIDRRSVAARARRRADLFDIPFAERIGRTALVAGTFDTKGRELDFIRDRLKALGIPVRTVDLSTSRQALDRRCTPPTTSQPCIRAALRVFIRAIAARR